MALSSHERVKRTRARHKRGAFVVPVEIYRSELAALAGAGLLSPDAMDRRAIGAAVAAAVARWAGEAADAPRLRIALICARRAAGATESHA